MKYFLILATVVLVMSGCTTPYQSTGYDDVYYSPSNQPPVVKHATVVQAPETNYNTYPDTTYYADNQQYVDTINNGGAYYDENYAARIRRFDEPYTSNN